MDITAVKGIWDNAKRDELLIIIARLTVYSEEAEGCLLGHCKKYLKVIDKIL